MHKFICCWKWHKLNCSYEWCSCMWITKICCFLILLFLKTTINAEELQLCKLPQHFTVDKDVKHLPSVTPNHCDFYARHDTCAMRWITFPTELFARETLCNIVLDLCTLHAQTQTDIACILFSPGGISVSEMKQTANISCLLHCRYYVDSSAADAQITVWG